MVGCLGGIGRLLTWWMVSRGARNFVFVSRSGLAKAVAKALVEDLMRAGANVKVVAGAISNAEIAASAVKATVTSIGGVIQAAMSLKESL